MSHRTALAACAAFLSIPLGCAESSERRDTLLSESRRRADEMLRVSLSDSGAELFTCSTSATACKNNSHPTVSYDGLRVVFDSDASDVVPGYVNSGHVPQVYVRDVAAGTTRLVSALYDENGLPIPPDGPSAFAILSGDGEWVAFGTRSATLDPDDGDEQDDVFLARITPPGIVRISENPGGVSFDGPSFGAVPSFDARYVAFSSYATDIADLRVAGGGRQVPMKPSQHENVYLLDRTSGTFEWLSAPEDGGEPNGNCSKPSIDEVGRRIAFTANATNLLERDQNGPDMDVFVRDRATGKLLCASANFGGHTGGNGTSRKAAISGDGRWVVFESTATDLVDPGSDSNVFQDVFVRDLDLNRTARISGAHSNQGFGQANGSSGYAAISRDGRFVVFTSFASNLVPNDTTSGFSDFFVRDRDVSGDGLYDEPGDVLTRLLSMSVSGEPANARSGGNCGITPDGAFAVFMSESNVLVPGDTNGTSPDLSCGPTCLFGRDVFRVRIPR